MRAHRWPGLVLVFALAAVAAAEPLSAAGEVVIDQPAITVFESSTSGTHLADALDDLGLVYTYRTTTAAFDVDLASGTFDVAMVNSSNTDITVLDSDIRTFLLGGGRVLMFLYNMDTASADTLWASLGAAFESSFLVPPAGIEIIDADHPIFNEPNAIGSISSGGDLFYADNGDYTSLLSRGIALAKSTGGDTDHLLIVARHDGQAILNTFLPGDFIGDADMVNLLENEITFIVWGIENEDFEAYPPPFELVFSPVKCLSCGGSDFGCFCDDLCIGFGDCCYDACQLCGRCQP